jgi:recombination protein RecA
VGVELGVITKSGAFYKYGEQMLGQGRAASVRYLQEHAKVAGKIEEEIWKKVRSGEKDVPREVGEEKVE